jgi:hypothetical protein
VENNGHEKRRVAKPGQDVLQTFLGKRHMGGLFFHCQLAKHLERAGFQVRQIDKHDDHADVWVLKLRRGHVPVGREIAWTQQQVCLFLKRHGLRYPRREVVVMVHGERIKAAFNWDCGRPGGINFQRPKAEHGTRGRR